MEDQSEKVVELHGALINGDVQLLGKVLRGCSLETMLQFEKTYGQTPLHLCIDLSEDARFEAMKHLLNSGLIDPYRKNAQGETAMECVANAMDLTKEKIAGKEPSSPLCDLIKAETASVSMEEAFSLVIRHGSILVFKEFRKLHPEVSNEQEFQCVSEALVELNMKCMPINPTLKIYLQWLLSKHSYTAMSGDAIKLNYKDWQHHIDVITESWEHLHHYNDAVELRRPRNGILRLIETIHNRLYILHFYYKNAFRHLPMTEVIFGLAVYLSIFKSPNEQHVSFKMIYHKSSIMEYIWMISVQLQKLKPCLQILQREMTEVIKQSDSSLDVEQSLENVEDLLRKEVIGKRCASDHQLTIIHSKMNLVNRIRGIWKNNPKIVEDADECEQKALEIMFQENFIFDRLISTKCRKLCKTIKKDYALAKQFYSVQKILRYVHNAISCKEIDYDLMVGATKKLIQVIGEAIKNTKETSNMPKKASAIVNATLTNTFADICKSHREFFSHGCPMSKILVDAKEDAMLFSLLFRSIEATIAMFEMLFVITTESVRQNFYGKAYRCRSITQLSELFRYVGNMSAFNAQQMSCITYVKQHIHQLLEQAEAMCKRRILLRDRKALSYVVCMLQTKASIIDNFHDHVRSRDHISYEDVTVACRQPGAELLTVRRLLAYNLRRQPNEVYDRIVDLWKPCAVQLSSLQWRDLSLVTLNSQSIIDILKVAERRTNNFEQYECPTIVLKWIEELKIEEKHHSKILSQLQNGKSELYRFMHDTYAVHLKWAFFERYCGKRNPKLEAMRTHDKAQLQVVFEKLLEKLRNVLSCVKIHSIEDLVEKNKEDISFVLPALEFYMLEICELLKSVNYFGDNTHWIRKGVPNMQGRNLRNSLAHDALSYRILTNSDEMHLFANALVMTDSKIDLFQDHKASNQLEITANNNYTTYQLDQQCRLLNAIREQNLMDTFSTLRAGCGVNIAHFLPKKCCRIKQNESAQCNDCLFFCKVSNSMSALLDGYIKGFSRNIVSAEFRYIAAIERADYATAFKLHSISESESLPPGELYYWPCLVDELKRDNRWSMFSSGENALDNLHQMVRCRNDRAVEVFISSVDCSVLSQNYESSLKVHPLCAAIIFGMEETSNQLIKISPEMQYYEAIFYAIKLHWNSIAVNLLLNVSDQHYYSYLSIAFLSNNDGIVENILEKMAVSSYSDDILSLTGQSLKLFGNVKLVKLSIKHKLVSSSNESFWNEVLYANIKNENWACVRYIIESKDITKSLNSGVLNKKICSPRKYQTCLQLLVSKGCRKLLNIAKQCMDLGQISQQYRYSDEMIHPMAIAISQHSTNRKLLNALERMGFDYLDCSSILQTAIQVSDQRVISLIMEILAKVAVEWDYLSESATHKPLALPMRVLTKWRILAYLQQPTKQKATTLHQAVEAVDLENVKLLLDRCRSTQLLEGIGRLDWIVFRRKDATAEEPFNLETINKYSELRKYCEEMTQSIIDADVLNTPLLTETVTSDRIVFYTPLKEVTDENFTAHLDKLARDMECYQYGDPIPEFFCDDACKVMFLTLVVKTGSHTKCAVKLNNGFCMIFALLDEDASNTTFVNFMTTNGQTLMHGCFPDATEKSLKLKSRLKNSFGKAKGNTDEQGVDKQSAKHKKEATTRDFTGDAKKILELLCSEGANPLLMQDAMTLAGIHYSFQYTADRSVALILIDHCIENDLRCGNGANLREHDDGDGNTLLHHAIMCDRLDVMKVLIEKKLKINAQNCVGLTPAMMAVCGGLQNPTEALRHLLEADVSTLNAKNVHQRTLLHYSVLRPGADILSVLLDYSPDFSIKDRQGNTAFREAVLMGHVVWLETALNFAINKKVNVTNSIDDIMVMITTSKFDAIASIVANYFYFAFDGDETKLIADLQAHGRGNLASYLKLITVGH